MKNNTAAFYIATLLIFGAALWLILCQGKHLESPRIQLQPFVESSTAASQEGAHFFSNLQKNIRHPLAILLMQIFCIMIIARILGHLMTKIGQPSVIGEIIAGIILGPSLLGAVSPEISQFIFPEESLRRLQVLSQIGLVLFMFIIGMELDISVLKKKAHAAVVISHVSIVFPYFLGVALAYFLYSSYAPPGTPFIAFALFMGIALSITAFPVLARIIQERNLAHSPLGTLIITCAAADDITAWCLLAVVVAISTAGGAISAVGSILLSILYVLVMWFIVKPLLERMAVKYDTPESINKTVVAAVFGLLLLSSFSTEIIGIHALFGAFFAGVIMPPKKIFKLILAEKIEDVSLVFLLPLFFVFTGLRTQIGLLNQPQLWGICFLIIGIAVLGKFVGSTLAAKFVGQTWKDSLLIGVLMNTRGLMELVVLNIGYDLGILSAEIFTMMVLMALITTFMAGPAIRAIEYFFRERAVGGLKEGFNTVLSFGSPQSGGRLLELAHYLNLKNEKDSTVTVVHFSPSADISISEAEQHEEEAFRPVNYAASQFGIVLRKIFGVSDNVEHEIIKAVHRDNYNLILVGSSRELFADDKTGGKVKNFVNRLDPPVGVFIDRSFREINEILLIIGEPRDSFLLSYARRFLETDPANRLAVAEYDLFLPSSDEFSRSIGSKFGNRVSLKNVSLDDIAKNFTTEADLVLMSLNVWEKLKSKQRGWFNRFPSLLIINK
ncbi:MAG: hypothetical protein A2Z88_07055 [Omnitrophica WOR_2 bacterium GWA2_47_8]|nr:MAG: hypothetical protein A2Z88_07055 [Omnitrophica WOR_2 bacterium GWA2_47_8]